MDDFSYGSRAKIGLIYPASGWIMEAEYAKLSPKGVITCTTRIPLEETNTEGLISMGNKINDAAILLSQAPLDIIALGCTSGSFVGGVEYEQDMIRQMEEMSGIQCITTSQSVVEALKISNIKNIGVVTPYIEEVNAKAKIYLEDMGLNVINITGLDLLYDKDIDIQPLEKIYDLVLDIDNEDMEAIVILCTGLRTIGILDILEKDLNKLVISAIQATYWNSLRRVGIRENIYGYGSLLNNINIEEV